MSIRIEELNNQLASYLAIDEYVDFCPNGLQIEGKKEIRSIATAVTADLATIQEAVEKGVDALIVHHGLLWNRSSPERIIGPRYEKIKLLLKHEISLFAYHLPLDGHEEIGNNWKAAKDLGWAQLQPFCEINKKAIGVKGRLEGLAIETLLEKLEGYYGRRGNYALGGKKHISSIALVSGGAYKELERAIETKIDCFISGNFDEPAWPMAMEGNVHFLAFGHTATEKIGPKALAKKIEEMFKIPTHFLDTKNPF